MTRYLYKYSQTSCTSTQFSPKFRIKMKLAIVVFLSIGTYASCRLIAGPTRPTSRNIENFRLSDTVKPSKYELIIEPNFTEKTFKGTTSIHVKAMHANTRTIVLHIADLHIDSGWRLTRPDLPGFQQPKGILTEDKDAQTVNLPFTSPLDPEQEYVLVLPYSGHINEANGFFFNNFQQDMPREQGVVYGTNLSPIYSRYLYPCFDEPNFKAEFQLTVQGIGSFEVISNGLAGERMEHER